MQPLISIFNTRKRSFGDGEKSQIYVQMDVKMREYLKDFTPSAWMVFSAISLMTDSDGWCYPDVKYISNLTGLGHDTIHKALNYLATVRIDDMPVLLRTKAKEQDGKFANNRYLIFPSTDEINKFTDKTVRPEPEIAQQDEFSLDSLEVKSKPVTSNGKERIVMPDKEPIQGYKEYFDSMMAKLDETLARNQLLVSKLDKPIFKSHIIAAFYNQLYGTKYPLDFGRINRWLKIVDGYSLLETLAFCASKSPKGNPADYIEGSIRAKLKRDAGSNSAETKDENLAKKLENLMAKFHAYESTESWPNAKEREATISEIKSIKAMLGK